jgi:outer membrane protein OmpA-like peptidoglycan-associated protein
MKLADHVRELGAKEKQIAYSVFQDSIPYHKIRITDGLGYDDRPYTRPEVGGGEFILNVGDGYTGMSFRQQDKDLLIHELVHVWQGVHSGWRWSYVFESGWHQVVSDDAYTYDKNNLKEWNSYNPEQQAQIVEDWFHDGMNQKDPRFKYIEFWIRGKRTLDIENDGPSPRRVVFTPKEDPLKIPSDVLFGFDSSSLKPGARKSLERAVEILNREAKGKTVIIEGHTDSTGSHAYNNRLSKARAQAVKDMLIQLNADNAAAFEVKGYGETRPEVPNSSAEGRARNRRVEFRYQ